MIREIRIGAKRGEPVHHENITVDDGDDDGGFSFEIRKVDVNPVGEDDGVNDRITPPLGGVVDGAPSESIGIMGIPSEFNDRLQKTAVSVSCSENVGRSAEKILCVRIRTLFSEGCRRHGGRRFHMHKARPDRADNHQHGQTNEGMRSQKDRW